MELKRRHGNLIQKDSESIRYEKYLALVTSGFKIMDGSPLCGEFISHIERANLKPLVLVDYHREAFVARLDSGVRLTFDHQIRYSEADRLFPDRCFFRSDLSKNNIMEIKTGEDDAPILNALAKNFGLMSVPNSKYANAIEHTQHGIWQ